MEKAIDSLLVGGDRVEILIVNDGSTKDNTAEIAAAYEAKYPGICRAFNKENGGHGDAVMTGIRNATGLYFKVCDSDDWYDKDAFPRVLDQLATMVEPEKQIDMMICNYIYDKVGVENKYVMRFNDVLPEGKVLTWQDVSKLHVGEYLGMHTAIYRTQLLHDCGLNLPKHTFYVDNLYVYIPLQKVEKLWYMNEDLYHYFIGRDDQSVQEAVMIKRIDQQILVTKLMMSEVDLQKIEDKYKRKYMLSYLSVLSLITTVFLVKSGTPEHLAKKKELWAWMKQENPVVYGWLRRTLCGHVCHIPGHFGAFVMKKGYAITQKKMGFN